MDGLFFNTLSFQNIVNQFLKDYKIDLITDYLDYELEQYDEESDI